MRGALGLALVVIVQTELHRTQDHVQELHDDVVVRSDFGDLVPRDQDLRAAERWTVLEPGQVAHLFSDAGLGALNQ